MIRVLIPYGTSEGQTARIAEYLAAVIRGQGHEAHAVDIEGSRNSDTDTSRDYVYTDWDRVRRFAEEFLEASFPKAHAATGG